jgi:hypothetical protein
LTEAVDGLRQSFASARASEPDTQPAVRKRSAKAKAGVRSANRKRGKSQS